MTEPDLNREWNQADQIKNRSQFKARIQTQEKYCTQNKCYSHDHIKDMSLPEQNLD